MRTVWAFLVWVFSFWPWKDFFLRWLRRRPLFSPAGGETAECLASEEEKPESEWAWFLSYLHEDERWCSALDVSPHSTFSVTFKSRIFLASMPGPGAEASYREFLEAVAASKIEFENRVTIDLRGGYDSCTRVEEFAVAVRQSRKGFRQLRFSIDYDDCLVRCAKCMSSVLLENDVIQHLHLHLMFNNQTMDKELAARFEVILAQPHVIGILKGLTLGGRLLDEEGMEHLMKLFQGPSSVLEELTLLNPTSDAQIEHVSGMLASSTSLKTLSVQGSSLRGKAFRRGLTSIATALHFNRSLKELYCEISCSTELVSLLDPLIPKNKNDLQRNVTLTNLHLHLHGSIGGKEGIDALVDLIHTNTSLLDLGFRDIDDLSLHDKHTALHDKEGVDNVLAILDALKINKYLKRISFEDCKAVGGYEVLGAMMDMLLENPYIQGIGLGGTGLQKSGDAHYISCELSKRKKIKLGDIVQKMAVASPTSGRVFLCGQPMAGKTRLRMSMKKLKDFQKKDGTPKQSRIKKKVQNFLKNIDEPKGQMEETQLQRTHGIEVDSVKCNGIGITIWDMAGQTDYHSFHELVMPNLSANGRSSMFLLMCNPMQQAYPSKRRKRSEIKSELEWWLRFIASNSRPSQSFCPHVSIVMTHFDHWKDDHAFITCIDNVVVELKLQFKEVLEFDKKKTTFKVDGRDVTHAQDVFDFLKRHMKALLERLPKTLSACEEVQHLVALWNVDNPKQPLLKWEEFFEGLCKKVEELNDVDLDLAKRKREFVAISLNDGGHIMYNEKDGSIITNPHWFCHHIIGEFLHELCAKKNSELEMVSSNGIIPMQKMKNLILDLVQGEGDMEKQFGDILGMMMKLHICYKQDASSIMIPSTLKEKHEDLRWSSNSDFLGFHYVGRRLACKDGVKTMLSLGFFARL